MAKCNRDDPCGESLNSENPRCIVPMPQEIVNKISAVEPQFDVDVVNTKLALRLASHTFEQHQDALLKQHGLSMAKFNVLIMAFVDHPTPMPTSIIANCWVGTRANLSQLITGLCKEGLLLTQPDPHDARARLLKLTPKGYKKVQGILPTHIRSANKMLEPLSKDEQKELFRLLLKVHDGIVMLEEQEEQ